ncbi:hypothetical protein [Pontibacillus litoralis]|uniref:RNA polymerase subunit sigma n=1 Tax=Pontibacillus litoralis JSM 072002 TaxID=1385512 RepID=A0A0A5GBC0_9BACI|nr:hypothetical protein [Pontibacillus litoralis]KGX88420.1 hypothetical protein N784_07075 [Pontibacillus litoralis JSM 072002]
MTLRTIEMQVALPRTQDAGKLQDQLQHRGQMMQQQIVANQLAAEQRKRKQVIESDQTEDVQLREESNESEYCFEKNGPEKEEEPLPRLDHPYLGKNIDFNG